MIGNRIGLFLLQSTLQTDHDELERRAAMLANVTADLADIGVVQSCIDFIEDKEWRRLEATEGEREKTLLAG